MKASLNIAARRLAMEIKKDQYVMYEFVGEVLKQFSVISRQQPHIGIPLFRGKMLKVRKALKKSDFNVK